MRVLGSAFLCSMGLVFLLSIARLAVGPQLLLFYDDVDKTQLQENTLGAEKEDDRFQYYRWGAKKDDRFPWVQQYQNDFPFSMQQTPLCRMAMNDVALMSHLARVAIADFEKKGGFRRSMEPNDVDVQEQLSPEMIQAEIAWNQIMTVCHGPLPLEPKELAANYTLRSFMKGLARCAHKERQLGGHHTMCEGEWCFAGWRDMGKYAFGNNEGAEVGNVGTFFVKDRREDFFVLAARCALKFEFPIVRQVQQQQQALSAPNNNSTAKTATAMTTNPQKKQWRPKRVLILTPTMGKVGATMGCKLVTTAIPRGWEVVLIEGPYRGIKYKYSDAIRALHLAIESSSIAAEDTLVVFADSMDVLVQRTPEYVAEAFSDIETLFAFSAEGVCFPMGSWPHSLGTPHHTCDKSFPETRNHYWNGPKYANTGGWIGVASTAFVVLKELSLVVENEGPDKECHERGTDQLIGNAAHLRSPELVGLDYEYSVFASGGWLLLWDVIPDLFPSPSDLDQSNWVYGSKEFTASGEEKLLSPAFLHFNGGGSSGGLIDSTAEALVSEESLKNCLKGRITIASIEPGKEKVWTEDFFKTKRWQECRANNHCAQN